jgi:hypothetical protein
MLDVVVNVLSYENNAYDHSFITLVPGAERCEQPAAARISDLRFCFIVFTFVTVVLSFV